MVSDPEEGTPLEGGGLTEVVRVGETVRNDGRVRAGRIRASGAQVLNRQAAIGTVSPENGGWVGRHSWIDILTHLVGKAARGGTRGQRDVASGRR